MKKILIIICILFSVSCSDDSIKIPDVVSEKYNIATKTKESTLLPSLYIKAHNAAGGIRIPSLNGGAGDFVKNEELQNYIESSLVNFSSILMTMLNKLNYIDFVSNGNILLSYNDENGSEVIFPDMLSDDGSLKRTFKYRRNFDRLFPRITEPLSRFLKIPLIGELGPDYAFYHKRVNNEYLIYLDYTAIKAYSAMLQMFDLDQSVIDSVNAIMEQYKFSEDVLEIGIYLKSVN